MAGSLRDLVSDDHVLARVDRVLDLSWLRAEVRRSGQEGHHPGAALQARREEQAGLLPGWQIPPSPRPAGQQWLSALSRPDPGLPLLPPACPLLQPHHEAASDPAAQGPSRPPAGTTEICTLGRPRARDLSQPPHPRRRIPWRGQNLARARSCRPPRPRGRRSDALPHCRKQHGMSAACDLHGLARGGATRTQEGGLAVRRETEAGIFNQNRRSNTVTTSPGRSGDCRAARPSTEAPPSVRTTAA